ncbi:hypothetical protein BKA62DRAFT_673725 [Auriculariales sp. MPI-PUGE-AT-0066]|nr:hypothetical protein BKA62DRAFT_673725 [Auriculariales sp. MPI-PUGE-AT-0066]
MHTGVQDRSSAESNQRTGTRRTKIGDDDAADVRWTLSPTPTNLPPRCSLKRVSAATYGDPSVLLAAAAPDVERLACGLNSLGCISSISHSLKELAMTAPTLCARSATKLVLQNMLASCRALEHVDFQRVAICPATLLDALPATVTWLRIQCTVNAMLLANLLRRRPNLKHVEVDMLTVRFRHDYTDLRQVCVFLSVGNLGLWKAHEGETTGLRTPEHNHNSTSAPRELKPAKHADMRRDYYRLRERMLANVNVYLLEAAFLANQYVPINRLPDDLLIIVFSLASSLHGSSLNYSQTCRSWFHLSRKTAALWAGLNFSNPIAPWTIATGISQALMNVSTGFTWEIPPQGCIPTARTQLSTSTAHRRESTSGLSTVGVTNNSANRFGTQATALRYSE